MIPGNKVSVGFGRHDIANIISLFINLGNSIITFNIKTRLTWYCWKRNEKLVDVV